MAQAAGESVEQSRELDAYDVAFLRALGLTEAQACARVQVDRKSVRRWAADPGRYLPPGADITPDIPQEIFYLVDLCQQAS